MKKIISSILVCMLLVSSAVFAANSEIIIDGETAVIGEGMGSVAEKDGVTFVPVRFVLENLGYEVTWSAEDKLIFARNEAGDILVMQVGSTHLIFKGADGKDLNLEAETAPYINETEGRTYVPLAKLAEVLGYETGLSEDGATVALTAKSAEEITETPAEDAKTEDVTENTVEDKTEDTTEDSTEETEENTEEVSEEGETEAEEVAEEK